MIYIPNLAELLCHRLVVAPPLPSHRWLIRTRPRLEETMVNDVYCSCHYMGCFHLRFRTFFSEETVSCLSICTYIWPSSSLVYVQVISNASKVHICHYLLQNIKICTGDHLMYVICE